MGLAGTVRRGRAPDLHARQLQLSELLDPASFFSGPRFFLQPKIRQQEGFGNTAVVAALRAIDDGQEALVLSRNEAGRPFRMHITDTRDMVAGILLLVPGFLTDIIGLALFLPPVRTFLWNRLMRNVVVVDLGGMGENDRPQTGSQRTIDLDESDFRRDGRP